MSNIDKRALREASEKATKGQWAVEFDDEIYSTDGVNHEQIAMVFSENEARDAAFIAAANPTTVLALLDELEAAEKRIAELESDNAYIRNRHKELDLLIGKNILVMQAAIIEWQGTGDARKGLAWIYNTLFGPRELPDESEKDARAYFDRKYAPLDEELMNLHRWFWEQSEAESAPPQPVKESKHG